VRVAIVAPPFISVPPKDYGGTELFIAHLAEGLSRRGVDVVVYTNGESTVDVEKRWTFHESQWPISQNDDAFLKDLDHTSWAVRDASKACDVIHLNTAQGLICSRLIRGRFVYTIHHPSQAHLTAFYARLPEVDYVCISNFQRHREAMPKLHMIHHGVDLSLYELKEHKQQYLSFIGRIAPIKGTHLAIEIAKQAGIPLKIAGEIQPMFRDYFEAKVKPHVDGRFIEYIGVANLRAKNDLLGNSLAMLFPIEWDEPFGLVMIEAMACGTPVLALRGGSVPEIVQNGVSGYVGRSVKDLVKRLAGLQIPPVSIRKYVEDKFSLEHMVNNYLQLYQTIINQAMQNNTAA
jgi:glycosyltransferase involved in cell wall biosynthesis